LGPALGLALVLALMGLLWPAGQLWLTHEAQRDRLAQQRLRLLQAQQEVRALEQKSIPEPTQAARQLQAISQQRFSAAAVSLSNETWQVSLRSVSAEQLALGWDEIRTQTSASLIQADLTAQAQGWSGTLVFKLARKP
jgi:hypothetical protein